jgi:hypothetical protein
MATATPQSIQQRSTGLRLDAIALREPAGWLRSLLVHLDPLEEYDE